MTMILMNNLFESFDPSTSQILSLNWINLILIMFFFKNNYWISLNRIEIMKKLFLKNLFFEFKNLINNKYKINMIIFLTLMKLIIMLNFTGLFPYIFTLTSQMSLNLFLSLPLWLSMMIYLMKNSLIEMLAHFLPLNSPMFLMNFMVLIEFISNFIRPWTLAIRLTANMIAGHLLLTLIGMFMSNFFSFFILSMFIQNMLYILEISVSLIQSYVFSILMLMYFSEID